MKRASRAIAMKWGSAPGAPLGLLLAALRALYQLHQSHHWTTKGRSYFADHLMFQRLYEEILPEIDSVAERTVGMGGASLVDALAQSQQTCSFLEMFASSNDRNYVVLGQTVDTNDLAAKSLHGELVLLGLIDDIEAQGMVSAGTRNLLEGIADTHESHVYLLQQRLAHL